MTEKLRTSTYRYRTLYNEEKAKQALNGFAMLSGHRVNKYLISNLMYLLERETLLRTGYPSLFCSLWALDLGLVLGEITDMVNSIEKSDIILEEQNTDELNDFEVALMRELSSKFGNYSYDELNDYMRSLPEYRNSKLRGEISYYEFFFRNGFSEDGCRELVEEIDYAVALEEILGGSKA